MVLSALAEVKQKREEREEREEREGERGGVRCETVTREQSSDCDH